MSITATPPNAIREANICIIPGMRPSTNPSNTSKKIFYV